MREYVWPIVRENLEDYYDMMLNCAKCKYCQNVFPLSLTLDERFASQCPSGDFWKFESYYASGRFELARGIVESSLHWSERARHILYTCTMCGACEENCRTTQRLTPLKTIRAMRERFIKDGGELLPTHKGMLERTLQEHNPFGLPHQSRFVWLTPGLASPLGNSEVVYFVGCTMCYKTPELALGTSQVLAKFGVKFAVLEGDEWCCGAPLIRLGLLEEGNKMLEHSIRALEKTGISIVVFSDPECYATFKNASLLGCKDPSFKIQHTTEFLQPIVQKHREDLRQVKDKVTFHDPCSLSRYLRIYEEPREILSMIPGIELIEMLRNRLNTYCSGGEMTVKEAFPEFALSTAKTRLDEAQAVGANTVVCADPSDYRNFRDTETELNVKDIMQVLLESLEGVS